MFLMHTAEWDVESHLYHVLVIDKVDTPHLCIHTDNKTTAWTVIKNAMVLKSTRSIWCEGWRDGRIQIVQWGWVDGQFEKSEMDRPAMHWDGVTEPQDDKCKHLVLS